MHENRFLINPNHVSCFSALLIYFSFSPFIIHIFSLLLMEILARIHFSIFFCITYFRLWCQCNHLTSSLIFIWGHVKYKFRYFCRGLTEKLVMTFTSLPVVPWTMLCMIDWWGLTVDVRLNEPENWTVTSWFQVIKVTDLFLYKTMFTHFQALYERIFFIWKLLIQVFCQNYIFTSREIRFILIFGNEND